MKIYAYKIDGNVIGKDIVVWSSDQLGNNKAFLISDVEPTNYEDISSIVNWRSMGESLGKDYIYVRERIREILIEKTFDACDADEKMIVSKLFLVNHEQRSTILTAEEEKTCWAELTRNSKICREERWEIARQKISFYLTVAEGIDLYSAVKDLSHEYKDANIPSLVCWVTNTAEPAYGIDYTTTGFAQKPYYTSELRDMVVDVLVSGNY